MDRALNSGLRWHMAGDPGMGSQEDCAAGNAGPIPESKPLSAHQPRAPLARPPAAPQMSKSGAAAALLRRVSTAAHRFHPTEIRGQRPACVVSFCSSFSLCCKVTEIPFHKRVCASGDMGHRDYHEATLALNQKQTATFQSGHF